MHIQTKLVLLTVCQFFIVETTSSFGSANTFQPLPGTTVLAHCKWEVKLTTVLNRIPQTITEILCQTPNEVCSNNSAYHCRQIRSKMLVGYTEGGNLVEVRNNTVSVGCSCVRRTSNVVQQFLNPINVIRREVHEHRTMIANNPVNNKQQSKSTSDMSNNEIVPNNENQGNSKRNMY